MRVLVTGATGFVGKYLCQALSTSANYEVHGTSSSNASLNNVAIHKVDLSDVEQTAELVHKVQPTAVIHLAGSAVSGDFSQVEQTVVGNMRIQVAMLEALRNSNHSIRLLSISSGTRYGDQVNYQHGEPIPEEVGARPNSPYAVSKEAQDLLALSYFLAHKLDVVRIRPFNQIGAGQTPAFAVPSFANQIVQQERNGGGVIRVGNLNAIRDFLDIRDAVNAYIALLEKGIAGEVYNLGSGQGTTMQSVLDQLVAKSTASITVETDPTKLRPVDVPSLVADNGRVKALGWEPRVPLTETLKWILESTRSTL